MKEPQRSLPTRFVNDEPRSLEPSPLTSPQRPLVESMDLFSELVDSPFKVLFFLTLCPFGIKDLNLLLL